MASRRHRPRSSSSRRPRLRSCCRGSKADALAIAASAGGAVYVSAQNVVYTFDAEGKARIVAGNGTEGYSGDGGPATQAQLNFPASHPNVHPLEDGPDVAPLALDADGRLLIGDASNNRVRRVDRAGLISTIATSNYPRGIAVGPDGSLYIASNGIQRHAPDGRVDTVYQPGVFGAIAVDALGDLFIAQNCVVSRLVGSTLVRVAGSGRCGHDSDGPGNDSALHYPQAIAIDPLGNVLIADTSNNCIRKLDRAGVLSRFAGRCGRPPGRFCGRRRGGCRCIPGAALRRRSRRRGQRIHRGYSQLAHPQGGRQRRHLDRGRGSEAGALAWARSRERTSWLFIIASTGSRSRSCSASHLAARRARALRQEPLHPQRAVRVAVGARQYRPRRSRRPRHGHRSLEAGNDVRGRTQRPVQEHRRRRVVECHGSRHAARPSNLHAQLGPLQVQRGRAYRDRSP